jgi:hypothetical protein
MKTETYRLSNEGIEDRHADLMAQLMDFKAEIDSRPPLVTPATSPRPFPWTIAAISLGTGIALGVGLAAAFFTLS